MDAPTVAVLGTGTMGAGMAANLARAGLRTRVWNRTRSRAEPLSDAGAVVADSVADAVKGADVVITMVFDADAVHATMLEARGALGPDTVWLQTSTVGVDQIRELAALAGELGVVMVDCPVLGTKKPAEDGTLVMLAAGDPAVRPQLQPVFDAVSAKVVWAGDVGSGTALKLACNAWVLTVVDGIGQSLALARELGVDPALFLEAVAGGAVDAPYVQLKGKAMTAGEHPVSFRLDGGAKDAALIEAAATSAGLDATLIRAVRGHLERAIAAGHGDEDLSAAYFAHEAGR